MWILPPELAITNALLILLVFHGIALLLQLNRVEDAIRKKK